MLGVFELCSNPFERACVQFVLVHRLTELWTLLVSTGQCYFLNSSFASALFPVVGHGIILYQVSPGLSVNFQSLVNPFRRLLRYSFGETASSGVRSMTTPTVVDEEANEIQQLAMGRNRQQAQHVTILRPVDAPARDVDQPLAIVDGATADPRSAVAVDSGPRAAMDVGVLEPTSVEDTTVDTDLEDSDVGDQTPELAEDADPLAHEVEPPAVDFGWGIVVGELSGEDFTEILSMPKL